MSRRRRRMAQIAVVASVLGLVAFALAIQPEQPERQPAPIGEFELSTDSVADVSNLPDMVDPEMAEAVAAGRVVIGMTAHTVLAAWGEPRSVNTTITAGGSREQWVYSTGYVYLTNGRVDGIQTSR
jgi:hypothetical protein